ncbi:MAG: acyltransferase, partial [Clostridia bacterium]|nr:acyltransferase [Clostridia bacterium]
GTIPAFQFVPLSFFNNIFIIGVNLFFLLSGYFKINFRPSKVLLLIFKVYFYWLVSQLLAFAIGIYEPQSVSDFLLTFIIAISKYWFIVVYILLCITAPLLNSFAQSLSKAGVKYFISVSLAFFVFGGFVADIFYPYFGTGEGFLPLWAWIVYLYGRFIKIYWEDIKLKTRYLFLIWAAATLLNFASLQLIYFVYGNGKMVFHFFAYNNPFIVLASVSLFTAFARMNINSNKRGISVVAGHTLAVYLLHSNNMLISPYRGALIGAVKPFWAKMILLFPNMLCLFMLGVTVDIIYEFLLGKYVNKLFVKIENGIKKLYEKTKKTSDV